MAHADSQTWAEVAAQWIAWVRAPDHDAFWAYRAAFEEFVGPGPGQGIEIGAGEGRISRVLSGLGYAMTLVEQMPAFLEAARVSNAGQRYIEAPATAGPEPDARFDLVFLYNMLMDVEDLTRASREAARLMAPVGRMVVGLVHPLFDLVSALKQDPAPSYFESQAFDETVAQNGLTMRFRGWARPLSAYVSALSEAGLAVTRLEEPRPDPVHPAAKRLDAHVHMPMFLWFELRARP